LSGYIGSYELLKKLGEGNFGAVYAAVGEVPGRGLNAGRRRLVAVKQLKHSADQHSKDLLVQEFGLLDQVRNRSIVRVFEYIPNENAVAMEYIHGVTLSKMLEELKDAREQVFTEAAIEIACEVADALYQAWTTPGDNGEPLRLVHRDLKPENIMLTPSGEVKILDFGLAHVDNADFARDDPDRLKGTPIYMAPEQARGDTVDHRTDLFALGLMTYELLMSQAAYRVPANSSDPLGDIFDAIERGALLDQCRELESKLPGVGPVLTRLLQPNPRSRYQDGQGLLVDLRRQLYKDRGSYLKEFCEFFFGAIYDLPDPPDMNAAGDFEAGRGAAAPASSADAFKQRVQASMARGGSSPDRGGGGRAQAFNPTQSKAAVKRGRPRADIAGRGAPQPRARDASPPRGTGGRPPGGRSPGNQPPRRGGTPLEPIKPRKILGARSPDETGMLPLMDLSDAVGQEEEPSTATAFFAIPAPKTKSRDNRAAPAPTAQSTPHRAPPLGASSSGSRPASPRAAPPFQAPQQPPAFSPPPAQSPGGFGAPPGNAYTTNQGTPPGIAPAPIGIQGPVAAGPVAGQGYAAPPPPAANDPKRTSSNRIYAVVLGLVMLMGVSTAATVWWVINKDDGVEPVADTIDYEPRERIDREPEVADAEDEDEELDEELPDANNGWVPPPPTYNGGGNTAPVNNTPKEPEKPSGAGALTVVLTGDGGGVTGFQLACPSGYNKRAGLAGGAASFAEVPQESCTLTTRGAKSGAFQGATAHMALTCSFDSGAFNCF